MARTDKAIAKPTPSSGCLRKLILLCQTPEERDVLVRFVPAVRKPCPTIDLIPEFRVIDRDIERVEPTDDFLHQRAHLVIVEVEGIIPRYLPPIGINDANIGIVTGMVDRDDAGVRVSRPVLWTHIIASVLAIMAAMRFSSSRSIGPLYRQIIPVVGPFSTELDESLVDQLNLPVSRYTSSGRTNCPVTLPDGVACI